MTKCYNCCGLEVEGEICPNCGHSLHDYKMTLDKIKEVLPHVEIVGSGGFSSVGPLKYQTENLLSYAVNQVYRDQAGLHPTLSALFCRPEDKNGYFSGPDFPVILSDDPALDFFKFHNYLVKTGFYGSNNYPLHSCRNGDDLMWKARGITMSPGVIIGVDGGRIYKGLRILHGGGVEIGDNTFIGANTVIVRGVWGNSTRIGENCFVGQLCSIGHNTIIGDNCLILPKVTICGSCEIGNDVRISPGAIISDHIRIGDGVWISIGSLVTQDVPAGERVTGHFALPHRKWIDFIRGIR